MVTSHKSQITNHKSQITNHQSLITNHQSQITSHKSPVTNHQSQITKKMKTHKDLDVWKNAIDFVVELYQVTAQFPKEEMYGITSQMRRAAVSIPSNIAEGAARNHKSEFRQFLYIALSSAAELETQLIISEKLTYIQNVQKESLIEKLNIISRMLQGLIKSINR